MMEECFSNEQGWLSAEGLLTHSPVPTFVLDRQHHVRHWNRACEHLLGCSAAGMLGTDLHWRAFYKHKRPTLADFVLSDKEDVVNQRYFGDKYEKMNPAFEALVMTEFFPSLGESGIWIRFTAAPVKDEQGELLGAIATLEDVTRNYDAQQELIQARRDLESLVLLRTRQLENMNQQLQADILARKQAESELRRRNHELTELNEKLSLAQQQLLQSEKMAALGQLAAGVAHEINNPMGYILSNVGSLQGYVEDLFGLIQVYENCESSLPSESQKAVRSAKEDADLPFLQEDFPELINQTLEGIERVRKIVMELKEFARSDTNQEWQWADLHRCIDSTLNIVNNEVKYKADVIREYGMLPNVQCIPSQINQVIMNLVVNACHAMTGERGKITITTACEGDMISLRVSDTGSGIAPEHMSRIFEPFFTTKPVSKGTGLGLSLSYGIVKKHRGDISVTSEPGKGASFLIRLPVFQTEAGGVAS